LTPWACPRHLQSARSLLANQTPGANDLLAEVRIGPGLFGHRLDYYDGSQGARTCATNDRSPRLLAARPRSAGAGRPSSGAATAPSPEAGCSP
jgi:hypothetical protein